MAVRIKTPLFNQYKLPNTCVVCNDPASEKTISVSAESGLNRRTMLNFKFFLCQVCAEVNRTPFLARFVRILGFLLALPFCLLTFSISFGKKISEQLPLAIGMAVMTMSLVVLGIWLSNVIINRGKTKEQRERRKLVERAVKIEKFSSSIFSKGWILWKFENESYAKQFSGMNEGEVQVSK